jgi:hypothetical protein
MTADNKHTIPRSARLPSTAPAGVRPFVAAVAEIAGAVSRDRLASHLRMQKTGAFSRAIGSALLYGFLDTDSEKRLVITERGSAFVGSDAEAAKRAEREGLASTGFGLVIRKLSTRAASEAVIALRLQEDLHVPEGPARDRAALLVAGATDAGLVVNGNFDGGVLEDTFIVIGQPEAPSVTATKQTNAKKAASATSKAKGTVSAPTARSPMKEASGGSRPATTARRGDEMARKADLPSAAPSGTKRVVTALDELAGPASRERVAGRLKAQLTGRLAAAIASALLYGFMEVGEDDKLVMTERGRAFIGDDAAASQQAQREALMSTGFAATINRLRTHKADDEIISARLQEDLGLAEGTASERAKTLVKAATDAGLAVDGRFDAEVIEDTIETLGELETPTPALKPSPKPKITTMKTPPTAPQVPTNNGGASAEEGGEDPPVPFSLAATAPLQVVLHIDASKLDVADIGAIVRELRSSVTVSISGS